MKKKMLYMGQLGQPMQSSLIILFMEQNSDYTELVSDFLLQRG